MRSLGMALLLGGYALVYAAVAKSGRFATEPWMGFIQDAYDTPVQKGSSPGAGAPVPGP